MMISDPPTAATMAPTLITIPDRKRATASIVTEPTTPAPINGELSEVRGLGVERRRNLFLWPA
jgi:hypothetical protein